MRTLKTKRHKQKSTQQLLRELRAYNRKWNKPDRDNSPSGSVLNVRKGIKQ